MSKILIVLAGLILAGPWAVPAQAFHDGPEIVKEDLDRSQLPPQPSRPQAPEGVVILSTASFAAAPAGAWLPAVREIAYSRSEDR